MISKPFVVVVGIDYSRQADYALESAYDAACRAAPAELHVAHLWMPPELMNDFLVEGATPATLSAAFTLEDHQVALRDHVDRLLAALPTFRAGTVGVATHVAHSTPVRGLTELASTLGADLVVVGSHGRQGVVRWLLGSVAEGLVRQASCPVLVIPPESSAHQTQSSDAMDSTSAT
jgi:nucleotide-binding universal stress UspA family protein